MNHPTAFCFDLKKIKAIVLGADPSNLTDKGKRKILTKAFGIGDGEPGYFRDILKNLKKVGLCLENIYVDNLIQEYMDDETSKNKDWNKAAVKNIPGCLSRLDIIDRKRKIPVVITAEEIYKVLLNEGVKQKSAGELYADNSIIPVSPMENKLCRPLIPFYRNYNYSLEKFDFYKNKIKAFLNQDSQDLQD